MCVCSRGCRCVTCGVFVCAHVCDGVHMSVLCICALSCDPEGPVPETLIASFCVHSGHFYEEECPGDGTVCALALTPAVEDQVE